MGYPMATQELRFGYSETRACEADAVFVFYLFIYIFHV